MCNKEAGEYFFKKSGYLQYVSSRMQSYLFNFLAAWKTPIRVNNELMEKARKRHVEKPEEDEVAYKRRKLCEAETKQMDYLKELLAGADAVEIKQEEDRKANVENKSPPVVTFTGFCEKFVEYVSKPSLVSARFFRFEMP